MPRIQPKKAEQYPWYVRLLFWIQKRRYGKILTPTMIWARSPRIFLGLSLFFAALDRKKSPIHPQLRALIAVKVSETNHCAFCIDLNSARALKRGSSQDKLDQLTQFEKSSLFTPEEKIVLKYCEMMTSSHQEVTDDLFEKLKRHYTDDEIVEITALIAFQNCSSKFNSAIDLPSEGFCKH